MVLPKKHSLGLAVGGAALAASGYFAFRRYRYYKDLMLDLACIPWDVPKEYTSWKSILLNRKPVLK